MMHNSQPFIRPIIVRLLCVPWALCQTGTGKIVVDGIKSKEGNRFLAEVKAFIYNLSAILTITLPRRSLTSRRISTPREIYYGATTTTFDCSNACRLPVFDSLQWTGCGSVQLSWRFRYVFHSRQVSYHLC